MFIKIYVRNVRISYKLNKLSAKIDFDTAENEPCEVCSLSVYGSSGLQSAFFAKSVLRVGSTEISEI